MLDQQDHPTILIMDRRDSPRSDCHEEVAILVDSAGETRAVEYQGWAYNASDSGVCFRCRENLPEQVRLQLPDDETFEVSIARRHEVVDSVWEYGGKRIDREQDEEDSSDSSKMRPLISVPAPRDLTAAQAIEGKLSDVRDLSLDAAESASLRCRFDESRRMFRINVFVAFVASGFAVGIMLGFYAPSQLPALLGLGAIAAFQSLLIFRNLGTNAIDDTDSLPESK